MQPSRTARYVGWLFWTLGTIGAALLAVGLTASLYAAAALEAAQSTEGEGQVGIFYTFIELAVAGTVAALWGCADGWRRRLLMGVIVRWTVAVAAMMSVQILVLDVGSLIDGLMTAALFAVPYVGGAVAGWLVGSLLPVDPQLLRTEARVLP